MIWAVMCKLNDFNSRVLYSKHVQHIDIYYSTVIFRVTSFSGHPICSELVQYHGKVKGWHFFSAQLFCDPCSKSSLMLVFRVVFRV